VTLPKIRPHRRGIAERLSFDVDRLLGRSKITPRGIQKSRGKRIGDVICDVTAYAARLKPLHLDAPLCRGSGAASRKHWRLFIGPCYLWR